MNETVRWRAIKSHAAILNGHAAVETAADGKTLDHYGFRAEVVTSARIAALMWSGSVGQAATSPARSASRLPPSICSPLQQALQHAGVGCRKSLTGDGFGTRNGRTVDPEVAGSSPVILAESV